MTPEIPDKVFFKIGEVSRITDIPEHTLRYWEEEFGQIRPQKTRSGQRLYRRKDIDTLLRIKQLLWEEKFKIEGARRQLERTTEQKRARAAQVKEEAHKDRHLRSEVTQLKKTLRDIRREVDGLLSLVK